MYVAFDSFSSYVGCTTLLFFEKISRGALYRLRPTASRSKDDGGGG